MEKFIVTKGKTIELAISAALEQLKLDRDSVSVEVLKNAKSGFLGIGASPAEVKVSYEVPDEVPAAPKSALSSASRSAKPKEKVEPMSSVISRPGKKPEPEKKPERKPVEKKQEKPAEKKQEKPNKPAKPAEKKPNKPAEKKQEKPVEKKSVKTVEAPAEEVKTYAPAAEGSVEAQIETFLSGLLKHMGSEAVPHAYKVDEETYRADLVGGDAGLLIGRRGDTLDAIQYLTSYAINRERETRLRINVDAGAYRQKREDALRQLANKMAAKAAKYHRNFTLEPMNAYERHVIHAALQDYPEVTTFSTGTEPHRRIVVAYSREK